MPRPAGWVADLLAVIIVGVYVGIALWLILTGKPNPDDWDRDMKIYAALTPLAGGAIGCVFGREVNRREADAYRRDAQRGRALAEAIRTTAERQATTLNRGAPAAATPANESDQPVTWTTSDKKPTLCSRWDDRGPIVRA